MPNTDNLARWGRNYLLTQPTLDEMLRQASLGDIVAQAALCILSKSKSPITNGTYCAISQQRAKSAVNNGLQPPYLITIVNTYGENGREDIVHRETCIVQIDVEYKKQILSRELCVEDDLIKEFLD